jgi:hypothetical protein
MLKPTSVVNNKWNKFGAIKENGIATALRHCTKVASQAAAKMATRSPNTAAQHCSAKCKELSGTCQFFDQILKKDHPLKAVKTKTEAKQTKIDMINTTTKQADPRLAASNNNNNRPADHLRLLHKSKLYRTSKNSEPPL